MRRRFWILCACLCLGAPLAALEGFESGLGAWTAQGLWHRATAPGCVSPHAGAACAYFGRDGACNYDDHLVKDASLSSAPVSLTDPARAFISFWAQYQVESDQPSCYDQLRLELTDDGGAHWTRLQLLGPGGNPPGGSATTGIASGSGLAGTPLWQFWHVDLSAYLGLTISLRFRFVSSGHQAGDGLCLYTDADFDGFLGYALDDINFYAAPEPLRVVKSVSPAFGAPGATVNYTLVAGNRDTAAQSIRLWDSLPAGMVFVGASGGGTLSGSRVDWPPVSLGPGASLTVTLQVQAAPAASAPQDWVNVASAANASPGSQMDSAPVLFKLRSPGFSLRKSVSPGTATSGDDVTYNLVLENFTAVTQGALVLLEQFPLGFSVRIADPAMQGGAQWPLSPMVPGDVRTFSLWGPAYGNDGDVLVNTAVLAQGGAAIAQASASLSMQKPIEPQVRLKGVYPNPAPGGNPAYQGGVHIAYELNQVMPMTLDIFTVAGEKLRSFGVPSTRGVHDVVWDLKNDWGNPVASGAYAFRLWSSTAVRPTPQAFGYVAVLR